MRAQTTLDFAIGISLFLIVVVYVLTFVPGVFAPFDRAQESQTVAVDRVASNLVEGQLTEPDEPYRLNRECTLAFFNQTSDENVDGDDDYAPGSDCRFRDVKLNERLAVQEFRNVNVTLKGDFNDLDNPDDEVEVLCFDVNSDRIIDGGDEGDGEECDIGGSDDDYFLTIGETPPTRSRGVSVARRIVRLEDQTVTVIVRMW